MVIPMKTAAHIGESMGGCHRSFGAGCGKGGSPHWKEGFSGLRKIEKTAGIAV